MRTTIGITAAIAICGAAFGQGEKPATPTNPTPKEEAPKGDSKEALDFKVNLIDGTEKELSDYKGKVVVVVNVASKCGLTPQYQGLEKIYKAKKDEGLVILGFPANNFGQQEPGSNPEIAAFCKHNYDVTFPIFEKISVKGDDQHALYKKLVALPAPLGGEIKWNFTKFVVDRDGKVAARFEPKTTPDDPAFTKKIDELLAAKPKKEEKQRAGS